jgi:dolichyl-phosphate-mannose-protein mannosyltransferase
LVLAAASRGVGLGEPDRHYFDESFYAVDACTYARPASGCGPDAPTSELTTLHPPLGKWLIAGGIEVLGYRPVGWRVASAVAGVAAVGLLFVLARRLSQSLAVAVLASGLLTVDFLHVVHSRLAMLDGFLTMFILAAAVCWERDRRREPDASQRDALRRPWRIAAGVCLGLALATKWTAAGAVVAVGALIVAQARRQIGGGRVRAWGAALVRERSSLLVAVVAVPLVVYALTYVGRLDAPLLAAPWDPDSWVRELVGRQRRMLSADLSFGHKDHPFSSPAWSWPLLKRPVPYYFDITDSGRVREILGAGNPLMWWPGLAALAAAAWRVLRGRASDLERLSVVAASALYLPLLLLGLQRSFTFLYYVLPVLPFLYLALADAVVGLAGRVRVQVVTVVATVALASFAWFAPLLYAVPVPYESWRSRLVFQWCDDEEVGRAMVGGTLRDVPAFTVVGPPVGWCWL